MKKDGCFIAVENEWTDYDAIRRVFDLWGRPVWKGMQEQKFWKERLTESGFTIESCDKSFHRNLKIEDNELAEQAHKFGIDIGLRFTLYILRKQANV